MEQILKQARLLKAALDEGELDLINRQALRPLAAEEVFTFRLAACNNQVDRDCERFTDETLEGFAALFVGRPVLRDHDWETKNQTARVYAAGVEPWLRRPAESSWCSGATWSALPPPPTSSPPLRRASCGSAAWGWR